MNVASAIDAAYRAHWARLIAMLTRRFGALDLAEDCLQDAFAAAGEAWQRAVPNNPAAWLLTAATRRALDRLRRQATAARKAHLMTDEAVSGDDPAADSDIPDERLALIALCCDPVLSPEARVALTLRLVGGLTAAEIARLFFGATMISSWHIRMFWLKS